jgi:hypothetical protein
MRFQGKRVSDEWTTVLDAALLAAAALLPLGSADFPAEIDLDR